jgi:hypothetical protein
MKEQHAIITEIRSLQGSSRDETRGLRYDVQAGHLQDREYPATSSGRLLEIGTNIKSNTTVLKDVRNEIRSNFQLVLSKFEQQLRRGRYNTASLSAVADSYPRSITWRVRSARTMFGLVIVTVRRRKRLLGDIELESSTEFSGAFFMPAPWMFSVEAILNFSSRLTGFTVGIRQRQYITPGNKAFDLVRKGDLHGVVNMLRNREITVFDCEPGRGTLLHSSLLGSGGAYTRMAPKSHILKG